MTSSDGIRYLSEDLADALPDLAIISTDSALSVRYANAYAINTFNLDAQQVATGNGLLPITLQQQIAAELKQLKTNFILYHATIDRALIFKVTASSLRNADDLNTDYVLHMHDITSHVATEQKLKHTEKVLKNLIEASPDFICVKDDQDRWLDANGTWQALFQLNHFQNKTDIELAKIAHPIFKETFQHSQDSDKQAWLKKNLVRDEEVISLPLGGEKVFDIIKIPLFHEDGSKEGIITLGHDITERKAAETHLRNQEALLDVLISCDQLLHSAKSWQTVAPLVLEQICTSSHFCRASLLQTSNINVETQSKRLFQWSDPNIMNLGEEFTTLNYETDGCGRWLGLLQEGNPVYGATDDFPQHERKFLQNHGTQSIIIAPIFSGDVWWGLVIMERCNQQSEVSAHELGVLMAIGRSFGVAIHREHAGKRLHEAKIAFDSATEGMMIIDENMHITAINKGYTEITGYPEDEVLGSIPKVFQMGQPEMWNALLHDEKWRSEITNERKNGEPFQAWLTITVVKDHEGRVINYVAVFADITESKRSQNNLHKLVNHDTLTGLPNRRLLNELMEQAIRRAEREDNQVALLFIDLDRFKAINDTLGHQVGDKLLYEVSRRISRAIRESDVAARLGGDEFLVVMDLLSNPEDAATVARKIINALQIEFVIDGREIFIGASVGISVFPKDGSDVDSLIKAADIAMYHVKNSGKNNHCFYADHLSENAVERFTMENHLRRALEREQFEIYYQPQVSLLTNRIIGAEALIRWIHPELGIVSPATFIPLAEEIGIIVQIGEWVLQQAALKAVQWKEEGYAIQWIAVNVSGIQVMRSNFADTVYGILVETDCDPSMIELEITESTIMHNTEYVIDTFNRIKRLGVKLAIDDFGTGYSSLSHLKRLPLDKLKIDQSFVRDLPDDQNDAAIANAINAMARSLGFSVIAEGVETVEQANFLLEMGCEEAQGYLYSRPVTAISFTELLQNDKLKYNN
ncbi:cyclic di-GMP phosphodiesterase Gmr [mine drainage metagenome]|uniref:Cyclic di-GMP phosphodiesterase Gmr n=1 Tax=mine drainage metagenome TaxID=410659 RepID=A0A1J5RHJ7_9ZZZZ